MTTVDDTLLPGATDCERILDEALDLAARHAFGARLLALVDVASGHLDRIDVRLLALHPLRHAPAFATAARLQRRLEQVQAAIPRPARLRPRRERDRDAAARTR